MNNFFDIVVIGAGPAGLMSADRASEKGAKVLLLEKMEKPARKLRISGKGRCNITNTKNEEEFLRNVFPDSGFFKPAFKNFSNIDLVNFLNKTGLKTVEERGGRIFPASQNAWDVANAMVKATEKKAQIECNAKVVSLEMDTDSGLIKGLSYEKSGKKININARAFIIATGGISYPATGSTGDGYRWSQQSGHRIIAPRPSLTGLELEDYEEIKNVSLKNVELSLIIDGGTAQTEFGELEFTKYGITGPTVLKISRNAVDAILDGKQAEIRINFKPALSEEQIRNRIGREIASLGNGQTPDLVRRLLPSALVAPFIGKIKISPKKYVRELKSIDTDNLITGLTSLKYKVSGFRPFEEAIVTAGGVDLKEINSKTMRSKLVKNLFFAGEIMNLDANTGGYNLQIAFSTGYLAGQQAAEFCKELK
ncbi:MAG: NAD(P)/FAD-dependent oxidoreductase [Prevotellaceae bacterium]|jgi:predicted Rossmann fold flavoprotein|nr:NAD(P)/FAD-dependent oxidoreductase [Prevotellaceae bacterium]